MVKNRLIGGFVLLFALGVTGMRAAEVTFRASAPEAVVAGEHFRLSYTLNTEAKDFRLQGNLPDFEVLMGPSQSTSYNTQIVNGKMSTQTSLTFTYVLVAKKEGTFSLPAATAKVDNATYTSNTVSVRVLPPDKQANAASGGNGGGGSSGGRGSSGLSKDDVFMRLIPSKQEVYEQEGFVATLKLYRRNYNISGLPVADFPDFEGFLSQEVELPQEKSWTLENYNGHNYQVVTLKQSVLFPQRAGKLTIDGGKFEAVVQIPTQRRSRSFFDDFFDAYRDVNFALTPAPTVIHVKPLPAGKPEGFSGGVGDFTMTASISASEVKANEAVTIKLKISGNGNIRLLKNPEVKYPNDFDIFDAKVSQDIRTTGGGVQGSKTIEYTAIPRFGGEFDIPPVAFSYFDPKTGQYRTLRSESFHLSVKPVEGGDASEGSPMVANFGNKENVKVLGQDIRYLKVTGIRFYPSEKFLFGSPLYYLFYVAPMLLFAAFFVIYRKQVKENANIALSRTRRANKTAVKRLKNAGQLLRTGKQEAFYEEVLRALWGYLSDKLSIPQANLTREMVRDELSAGELEEDLIALFLTLLDTCEFARYAPSEASDAMDKIYEQASDAIRRMENSPVRKKKG
jgi:hypothetical protein